MGGATAKVQLRQKQFALPLSSSTYFSNYQRIWDLRSSPLYFPPHFCYRTLFEGAFYDAQGHCLINQTIKTFAARVSDNNLPQIFLAFRTSVQHPQTWWSKNKEASATNAGHRHVIWSKHQARRCRGGFENAKWRPLRCDAFTARRRLNWHCLRRWREEEYKGNKVRGMIPGRGSTFSVWCRKTIFLPSWNWTTRRKWEGASCLMFIPCCLVPGCCFTHWSTS